jgi:hypothetical protein
VHAASGDSWAEVGEARRLWPWWTGVAVDARGLELVASGYRGTGPPGTEVMAGERGRTALVVRRSGGDLVWVEPLAEALPHRDCGDSYVVRPGFRAPTPRERPAFREAVSADARVAVDGDRLAVADNGVLTVGDADDLWIRAEIEPVDAIALSGEAIATARGGVVTAWSLDGPEQTSLPEGEAVVGLGFAEDGRLAVMRAPGTVEWWSVGPPARERARTGPIVDLRLHGDDLIVLHPTGADRWRDGVLTPCALASTCPALPDPGVTRARDGWVLRDGVLVGDRTERPARSFDAPSSACRSGPGSRGPGRR